MDTTFIQEGFDLLGRRTSQTDQASKVTGYTYDGLGRLTKVTDALLQETTFTYDEAGNKLTQTDAEGRTTSWAYDSVGRVLTRQLPEGQTESFTYDNVGNMDTHTDFDSQLTTYTYDSNNWVARIDYHDGSFETFTYDNEGNRKTATNSEGTTSYDYDNRNRLIKETQANGAILEYEYDSMGNKTKLTTTIDTNVTEETYTYDALNRLETVTDANLGMTTYGYDEVGNRTSVSYPNDTSITYVYDNLNRLTQVNHYDNNGVLTQQFDYTLHDTGRREQIDELSGRSTAYTYDDLYRLTDEVITDSVNGNYSANYVYDKVGNRTQSVIDGITTAYTYDDNDRLTQQGGTAYTHDDNGNTETETLDGNTTTYTYNAKNNLTQVDKDAVTSTYTYNADGIRTSQTVDATETKYVVDTNRGYAQVLFELDSADAVQVQYTYGDDLLSQDRAGGVSYYHYDGLGSTRSLTDVTGAITDTYDYEAFGELLNSSGSTENKYLFTGEQYDAGLDQYYLRARYYDQGVGRFTQQDEWMGRDHDPVTLHKYLYAGNDPVLMVDPSGYSFDLSVMSISQSIGARLAVLSVQFPRGYSAVSFVAQVATPLELAALSPVSAGLAMGGTATYAAVKHLDEAQKLANSSFWLNRIHSGTEFEKFISGLINQASNTKSIFNGRMGRGGKGGPGSGWAVPDFFFKGGILEAKLSGGAVKKEQFIQFIKYLGDGGNLTYVFKNKPSNDVISSMQKWMKQEGKEVNLQIAYIFD